jgi:hypothetical protein
MRFFLFSLKETIGICCLLFFSISADAGGHEIPMEALLGNKKAFSAWKTPFKKWYTDQIDSITGFSPSGHTILKKEKLKGITLITVQFSYPSNSPLSNKPSGGVLAIPNRIDRARPIIIATHGHEHAPWGQHPIDLFKDQKWPFEIARAGYIVWAPVSMYHDEIKATAETKGYALTWTKIVSEGISYGQKNLWKKPGHGYAATGLSSGAIISFFLMAYRSDVTVGVFAGAEQDLDFLRREYRIKGHPACWEIKGVDSYTTVQALIAPRPIQFQSGRKDPFFPSGKAMEGNGKNFLGTKRAQLSTEPGGNALVLRSIYEIYGRRDSFDFFIHDGGHEMSVVDAIKFIKRNKQSKGPQ